MHANTNYARQYKLCAMGMKRNIFCATGKDLSRPKKTELLNCIPYNTYTAKTDLLSSYTRNS